MRYCGSSEESQALVPPTERGIWPSTLDLGTISRSESHSLRLVSILLKAEHITATNSKNKLASVSVEFTQWSKFPVGHERKPVTTRTAEPEALPCGINLNRVLPEDTDMWNERGKKTNNFTTKIEQFFTILLLPTSRHTQHGRRVHR